MTHLDSNGNWKPVAIVRSAINTDNRPPLVWSTDASVASTWSSTLSIVAAICFRLSAAFTAVRHRSEGVYGSLAVISRMIRLPKYHRKLRRHHHYKRQTYSPLLNSNTR
jgi:hypothetical protein